ncbi:MAG: peptidoglycan-associated lipoprotein Pal [Gammaproteobacteria bacterium]|nr:peptidoglycan-associated lipoprotein Pal [Gammaproteobacteria bacterium]HXK58241.1 peptidoglycan-associated lipoprotein Pal [Gammaproteobacteria bacterium]
MKVCGLKIAAAAVLSLTLAGCSTFGGKADGGSGDGAAVSEAGGSATSAADAAGEWRGNPLDNPGSPLSVRTIFFDYDESQIREDLRDVVIAHGKYLANNPTVTITVEGHADERGSREYNIALGERRANAVRSLMLAQGAADNQIHTVSYGEERPLMVGADEAAWSQNRRAELLY